MLGSNGQTMLIGLTPSRTDFLLGCRSRPFLTFPAVFRIRIQGCFGSGSGFQIRVFKNDYYDYDDYNYGDYDDYDYDDYDYDDYNFDYDYG